MDPIFQAALSPNNIPWNIFSLEPYWDELIQSCFSPAHLCLAIFPNNSWSLWPILTKFDRGTDGSKTLSTCKSSADRQPGTGEGLCECPTKGKATGKWDSSSSEPQRKLSTKPFQTSSPQAANHWLLVGLKWSKLIRTSALSASVPVRGWILHMKSEPVWQLRQRRKNQHGRKVKLLQARRNFRKSCTKPSHLDLRMLQAGWGDVWCSKFWVVPAPNFSWLYSRHFLHQERAQNTQSQHPWARPDASNRAAHLFPINVSS